MKSITPSIMLDRVTVEYNGGKALEDVNFEYNGAGLIQVLGPNGAGKTTLLKTILGLVKPSKGRVYVCGEDVTGSPSKAGALCGYVPQAQSQREVNRYPISVEELIRVELKLRRKRIDSVHKILELVGLGRSVLEKNFWELSGGEKQRVLIAKALIHNPKVLLLDEPLSPIDPPGRASIARLIGGLSREKLVIVTSHDPVILLEYTSEIILLNKKIYYKGPPSEVLCEDKLRRVYGEAAVVVEGRHIHISDYVCKR